MAGCLRSRGWVSWLLVIPLALGVLIVSGGPAARAQGLGAPGLAVQEYAVAAGSHPHDAVPDGAGGVWYTGQGDGTVGRLDPATGDYKTVDMGQDKAVWVTDGGLNAIVRIDPDSLQAQVFPLPGPRANLNTATFDRRGVLWFTGQSGYIGRLDPAVGVVEQFAAPRGAGPYGISTAPDGTVYFASLAGSYLGRIDGDDGSVTVIDPPTARAGVRRVWPDSAGRLWVSEYNAGQVGRYDPATGEWAEWRLPGNNPRAYAVYVDERDQVWLTDTDADTVVRFDPTTETFTTVTISRPSNVAQLSGTSAGIWGGERGRDHILVVRPG